jgi:ATP-dependent DNA ligase
MPTRTRKAAFVEPMLLLRAETLPEGEAWQYELKFDGYRALAIKNGVICRGTSIVGLTL